MIKYKINYSSHFKRELRDIYYYIYYHLNSPNAAKSLLVKIKDYISSLYLFPEGYSKVYIPNSSRNYNIRKIPINNYIIIYAVDTFFHIVTILHIFNGRQNYPFKL